MKIYTKTGDNGTTSLSDGTRVPKSDSLLNAYGTIDELNSFIGLLISEENEIFLTKTQNFLFLIGGMLATPTDKWDCYYKDVCLEDFILEIEAEIDRMAAELPPFKGFILPQGSRAIAYAHICRTVCRRAERLVVILATQNERYKIVQKVLNRLSDYFFILARFFHKKSNIDETVYQSIK
ncbi:MAG: cob(I)yrinic acid a,c-diamide adenosyltransferase [Bacteroidales bacterium]|nr:cob(I)yrinic acid a,c-diamide adenosyltransferase [Bacteroidales bacterium]